MDNAVSKEVRIYPDIELLSQEAAREMVYLICTVAAEKGRFTIALSGGYGAAEGAHCLVSG